GRAAAPAAGRAHGAAASRRAGGPAAPSRAAAEPRGAARGAARSGGAAAGAGRAGSDLERAEVGRRTDVRQTDVDPLVDEIAPRRQVEVRDRRQAAVRLARGIEAGDRRVLE